MSKSKLQLGVYQHYKGNRYLVLCEAKHSETLEPMVVYVSLYENNEGQVWVRPSSMFLSTVEVDGMTQPRFKHVG